MEIRTPGEGGKTETVFCRSDHVCVSINEMPKIWLRRRVTEDEEGSVISVSDKTEIITDNPQVEDILNWMEERSPEAVSILSRMEDGGIHALLGPNVKIVLMPESGSMEFNLESEETAEV
jgi:hypothetical protein